MIVSFFLRILISHLFILIPAILSYTDIPCQWKSRVGATYDLRALTITDDKAASYFIADGDIPCTPEIERTYSYVWNFCADVTSTSFPSVCDASRMGAALQYYQRDSDGYSECNVIGHYDPARDDTYFSLIDPNDPSQGVSMKYLFGDQCPKGQLRSATIDVLCGNVKSEILSALEPSTCEYHLQMKSYYGCPLVRKFPRFCSFFFFSFFSFFLFLCLCF
jgi:hypothetical protein